jgi:hypothetical protein
MTGKITLITPPDIFENQNHSVMFMHISEQDQEIVSKWLASKTIKDPLNFYVCGNESDVRWVLWSSGYCAYKYIDLDDMNNVTQALVGYLLSKPGVYYKTSDENLAAIYNYINTNRVSHIESFLERALSDQIDQS